MIKGEVSVHPSHQVKGWPATVLVEKEEPTVDPSHEEVTGRPRYKIGDRVSLVSQPGVINDVHNDGNRFTYQVKFDVDGSLSNYVSSSDLRYIGSSVKE